MFAVKVLSKNELFEFKKIQLFIAFGKYLIAFNAFLVIIKLAIKLKYKTKIQLIDTSTSFILSNWKYSDNVIRKIQLAKY